MADYYLDAVNGNDANDGGGFWKVAYTNGTGAQPAAGETGTGGTSSSTAKIIKVTGTWATSGSLYFYAKSGTFQAETVNFSGGGSCTIAAGDLVVCSIKSPSAKTFNAGDNIYALKSAETAMAGTGTVAAYPAATISTTNDLTASLAVGDVIRLTSGGVLDGTIYLIKAITSSVITLYRPYRGTAESGKTIYKLTLITAASATWTSVRNGTASNRINLYCGYNVNTLGRDGFTVINGPGSGYGWGNSTNGYWHITYLALMNFASNWGSSTLTGHLIENCFSFKTGFGAGAGYWINCTINYFVAELSAFGFFSHLGCVINDLETADSGSNGLTFGNNIYHVGNVYNRWKNAGYSGKYALSCALASGYPVRDNRFNDCVLDELGAGMTQINVSATANNAMDIVFTNPTIGAGALFNIPGNWVGEISFQHVAGSATDNRRYIGNAETGSKYWLISREDSVFHTAAPSVKISGYQSIHPYKERHYIPCAGGVTKTVSVWFRKNASYGSSTLPIMRLIWITGTAPNLTTNVHDEVMADTNDTWLQYSYAVTPSLDGGIIVELIFQSSAASAIAYWDDLEVA